jgi:hypothetical protein
VCQDYRDCLQMLAKLEELSPPDAERAGEYRQLAAELLAEAADMLKEK